MGKDLNSAMTFRCPVCEGQQLRWKISRAFERLESRWYGCEDCGALSIQPQPTDIDLKEYYGFGYASRPSPGCVSHARRFGEDSKSCVMGEYLLSLKDIRVSLRDLIGKKILDFGCANGVFLDLCFKSGCNKHDVYGHDVAEDLLAQINVKGFEILKGESNFFDVIFLWDVIEHIPKPGMLLSELVHRLKRGEGSVIVQTPRMGILSEGLGENFEHYLPVEHAVLYTRESIVRLFNRHGFDLRAASSFGANAPLDLFSEPYKSTWDMLAKISDHGATQVLHFVLK